MPFLNFGGNKNKYCNLSDMNFFMKNMKYKYSDPDPLKKALIWIRVAPKQTQNCRVKSKTMFLLSKKCLF